MPTSKEIESIIKAYRSEVARRGGKATSDAKRKAAKENLRRARERRWRTSEIPEKPNRTGRHAGLK